MADNDDKREDGAGGKKTLTLKGAPNLGGRPGMARSSRSTVVVEKRTRVVVPQRGPAPSSGPSSGSGAPRPHSSQPQNSSQRPPMRSNSGSNAPRVGGGLSSTEAEARQRAL
ncbi:MAG: translation initiation factor IF-2, partial [Allorhizobium sp.]